jgi:hypothetical protein
MEFSNNMFAIMAIVFAMGLVAAVAVDLFTDFQNAEAKGCNNEIAVNASMGPCIK